MVVRIGVDMFVVDCCLVAGLLSLLFSFRVVVPTLLL